MVLELRDLCESLVRKISYPAEREIEELRVVPIILPLNVLH